MGRDQYEGKQHLVDGGDKVGVIDGGCLRAHIRSATNEARRGSMWRRRRQTCQAMMLAKQRSVQAWRRCLTAEVGRARSQPARSQHRHIAVLLKPVQHAESLITSKTRWLSGALTGSY